MEIKTKLSIRAVIRWEQMTQRPFQDIDFNDEDDIRKALYCASVVYSETPYTYTEFLTVMENKRISRGYVKSLTRYNEYVAQFVTATADRGADQGSGTSESTRIGEVAANLIVHGLDAHFVLDEMTIGDIPMYIHAMNEKIQREEESRRLWTYLSVLPHVGSKKLKSPQKLYEFPWERHEMTLSEREKAKREFLDFMAGKIN